MKKKAALRISACFRNIEKWGGGLFCINLHAHYRAPFVRPPNYHDTSCLHCRRLHRPPDGLFGRIMHVYSKPKPLFVLLNVSFFQLHVLVDQGARMNGRFQSRRQTKKKVPAFFCASRFPFLFSFLSPQDPPQTNDANLTAIDEPTGARLLIFGGVSVPRSL